MKTNMQHRSEIATAKLVKAFIEERLWHDDTVWECGCALTQIGDGDYRAAEMYGKGGYSEQEAALIENYFEAINGDYGAIEPLSIATFDDLLRTVECLMELDKEYYERKPINMETLEVEAV